METTEEKKEVLFFNKKAFQSQKDKLEEFVNQLNRFGKILSALNLKLTPEILQAFSEKGHDYITDQIVEDYLQNGEESSRFLADQVRASASRETINLQGFERSFPAFILETGIPLEIIPIKDGKAVFSVEMEEKLQARHTIYLTKENKALFERLSVFCDAFNSLQDYAAQNHLNELSEELREVFSEAFYVMGELIPTGNYLIPDETGKRVKPNPYFVK